MARPVAGFNPRWPRLRWAEAHRLARDDVLPALKGGVSLILPTPMGFSRGRHAAGANVTVVLSFRLLTRCN
jgi:hypothetical protein